MCGSWCSRHLEREQATEDESLVQKSLAQIPTGRPIAFGRSMDDCADEGVDLIDIKLLLY
jgi:hypothetical protein